MENFTKGTNYMIMQAKNQNYYLSSHALVEGINNRYYIYLLNPDANFDINLESLGKKLKLNKLKKIDMDSDKLDQIIANPLMSIVFIVGSDYANQDLLKEIKNEYSVIVVK